MSIKEYLQFLAMMIPTLLLLALAALTLAIPDGSPATQGAAATSAPEPMGNDKAAVVPTEIGPLDTVIVK